MAASATRQLPADSAATYREHIASAIALAKRRPQDAHFLRMINFISGLQGGLMLDGDTELVSGLLWVLDLAPESA